MVVVQELQRGDPERLGPYRLVGRLGSGGMGRVFLGRSAGGRLVAVKVIRDELATDPDFRMRFGREVAAAKQVGGLFTALVVDADTDSPTPWLATAYVAGPSLADAVSTSGPLPPASVMSLAAGLAEGLGAIHAAGLVHRDLKPSNVLLAEDGPRVIDFGISRAAEASALTRTGWVIGSPGFMSPEQADGREEVGPASDVFSLGAVLVFAATGVPPFGTGSTAALVYRVVHGDPRLDEVPWQVRPVAERCLAKDPRQRPTPAELLAEFGDIDLAAAWLPTRVQKGIFRQALLTPADIESPPRDVSPEGVAQPDSSTAVPDIPDTVTGPRHQPEESPTHQPPPAAETAQPQAVEPVLVSPAAVQPETAERAGTSPKAGNRSGGAHRARKRLLWAAGGVFTAAVVVVVAVSVAISSSPPAPAPTPSRSSAQPSPSAPSSPRQSTLDQLRAGDCLSGSNLPFGTSNPWPDLVTVVPCTQQHIAEVFFAGNTWPKSLGYPGDAVERDQADARCNSAFSAYDGIPQSQSALSYYFVYPSIDAWHAGDRSVQCTAYWHTAQYPGGQPLDHSIKGSSQ